MLHCLIYIYGHDGKDSPAHGHGYANFVKGYTIKQNLHILNAIDGDSLHSQVSRCPIVVGIVPTMSGQIKNDQ